MHQGALLFLPQTLCLCRLLLLNLFFTAPLLRYILKLSLISNSMLDRSCALRGVLEPGFNLIGIFIKVCFSHDGPISSIERYVSTFLCYRVDINLLAEPIGGEAFDTSV